MVANLETIGPNIESQPLNNNFAALNSAKVEVSFLGSFGIGSNVTLRVSTDLNNEMNNGWVAVDPGTTANAPDSSLWGVCRTDRRGPTAVYQTVYRIDTANLRIYIRKCNGGTWSGWEQLWHSGNDGAGSGLDADLLDGMQPSTSASANTIAQRDSSGRIKAAAPSASDDVARKAEVDGKVSKSGDTMTGDLRISKSNPRITLDTTSGNAPLTYAENSENMWSILYDPNNDWLTFYSNVQNTGVMHLYDDGTIRIKGAVINTVGIYSGSGSPQGNVSAPVGSIYQNLSGGTGTTLYYKASGTGNTGWVAIA